MEDIHKNLAAGRWFTLSLAEQLANVGSEFERVISWKKKNQPEYADKAFDRLLELLDLTINDKRWHNHRLKELTRLREVICEELFDKPIEKAKVADLQKYFLYFGIMIRNR